MPISKWIHLETRSGEPYQFGGMTFTPFAQSLEIRVPGIQGGFEWARPVSVLIRTADGREEVIPVTDFTRIVQIVLLGLGFLGGLLIWRASRKA